MRSRSGGRLIGKRSIVSMMVHSRVKNEVSGEVGPRVARELGLPPWVDQQRWRRNLAAKRRVDRLMAGALLVAVSPVMVVVALAIKCVSPGPVLYRQQRVGHQGRVLWMWKFRTMHVDAEQRLQAHFLKE